MNKTQLAEAIASQIEISVAKAEETLTVVLDSIVTTLSDGGQVSLVGFGNFGVKHRAARKARNPQTGAEITIAAKTVPFFKAGKKLKDQVNGN